LNKTPSALEEYEGLPRSTVKPVSDLQAPNATSPILVTVFPIVTLVRAVQPLNALKPILVTLFGMVTLVKDRQLLNALKPILVTGYPPNILGMTMAPPGPV